MQRAAGWCLGWLLIAAPVVAAQPKNSVVEEIWQTAYLEGGRAGFVHTRVEEIERDGQKLLRTTTELRLTVQRFKDIIQLRMETGTEETPEGKVTGVSMKQFLSDKQTLTMTGTVEGNRLHVEVRGGSSLDRRIPWDEHVIGLYAQEHLYKERKVKPGDTLRYASYEPTLTTVVQAQVAVKDYEMVEVFKTKQRLLRVEAVPDKIELPGGGLQLPPLISWLDKDLQVVRSQVEMPGLGTMVLYRTTAEVARKPIDRSRLVNIGLASLIRLNRRIERPYDAESAVYRITLKNDDKAETAFARDGRQEVKKVAGNTFELHVQASRAPRDAGNETQVSDEFLKSCYFIKSDDPKVKEHTRRAIGRETDPWQKAVRIEQYVYRNVSKEDFSVAFAPADEVARDMKGDCTEHSMLAAAMCRAAGIPSRTAVGLVYVNHRQQGPVMAFHMWTEVWVRGQWVAIDPTFGRDFVGATHLKITDHSWHDTQSLTPLMPVLRVLGKLSIEVVRVGAAD
jgi:transglutaminase-like putative cysteine protease